MFLALLLITLPTFLYAEPEAQQAKYSKPTKEEIIRNWLKLVDPFESECACATGASLGDIKELWKHFRYPKDKVCLKCYVKCIYEKIGVLDSHNNVIKLNYQIKVLGTTDAIFDKCEPLYRTQTDLCVKFYEFDRCVSWEMGLLS